MGFQNTAAAPGLAYDQPITLLQSPSPGSSFTIGTTIFPLIDVSQYQSIVLIFNKTNNVNHVATVLLNWVSNPTVPGGFGNTVSQDQFKWAAADLNTPLVRPLPVRAAFLQVRLTIGGAGTNDSITVVGSNRPYKALIQNLGNRVLDSGTVGAGLLASITVPSVIVPRYDGPLALYVTSTYGGGATPFLISVTDLDTGIVWEALSGAQVINGANKDQFPGQTVIRTFMVPRNSWNVTFFNGSTTNTMTFAYEMIMVPEIGHGTT